MDIVYWTKEGKFETQDLNSVPGNDLHSPNEKTPAYKDSVGYIIYCNEGKFHRLSGPAWERNESYEFYIDGVFYHFEEWLKIHPNQNEDFQNEMRKKYEFKF